MHIRLIAVGDRQPEWVDTAVRAYTDRLPSNWRFRIDCVPTARRSKNERSGKAVQTEGRAIVDRIDNAEQVVLLDERGRQMSSQALSRKLSDWQLDGRNLVFIIGGPDGVSEACRARADITWSLSELTLPHGLARVLLVEQLYRAWSLSCGHPYHRD